MSKEIERNEFDNALRSVAVEISDIGLTIGRRAELGLTGWLTVQHQLYWPKIKR